MRLMAVWLCSLGASVVDSVSPTFFCSKMIMFDPFFDSVQHLSELHILAETIMFESHIRLFSQFNVCHKGLAIE